MCNTCGCKKAEDISKDIFGNKSDAMDRAKELGSNHTHSHKINGDVIHMPFKTHKEYQENMGAESFDADYFKESKHLKPSSPSNLSKYFAKKDNYIYLWIEDENGDYGVVGGKLHEGEGGPMDVPVAIPLKADIKKLIGFDTESFENETFCADCGSRRRHDAESFDAEVYAIEDGGKTELSFQELFDYLNAAIDNEYFLTKGERDDYYEKYYREYEAESDDRMRELENKAKKLYLDEIDEEYIKEVCDEYNLDYYDEEDYSKACSKYLDQIDYIHIVDMLDSDDLKELKQLYKDNDIHYYKEMGAESFEAPGSVAEDYSEVLHDLDDLEKNVKSIVAPKRRPTKYLRDAKSSVVDSWRQVRKDGFGRELYQPMDMDAESFEAESNFDKLANKIAAQYRAKGKSPAEAMRIGKATAAKIGFRKYGKAGMRRKAMAGRAKSAENYVRPQRIKVNKKSSIINYKSVGILSVAGILSYLHFKK